MLFQTARNAGFLVLVLLRGACTTLNQLSCYLPRATVHVFQVGLLRFAWLRNLYLHVVVRAIIYFASCYCYAGMCVLALIWYQQRALVSVILVLSMRYVNGSSCLLTNERRLSDDTTCGRLPHQSLAVGPLVYQSTQAIEVGQAMSNHAAILPVRLHRQESYCKLMHQTFAYFTLCIYVVVQANFLGGYR